MHSIGNKLTVYLPVGIALFALSGIVQSESLTVYGKIHLSGDIVDNGDSTDYAIGSNSSRIGFKGDKKLKYNLKAIWKLESDIDASGERGELKARNRYLGLKHEFGAVIVGYHDTPFKSLGAKAGVLHDTIAERRGILGAGNGSNKFNIRGKNSVLYISPNVGGVEIRAMRSTGDDESSSVDEKPITSVSAVFKNKAFYAGVAYEDQKKLDATGFRVGVGANIGNTKINAIFEQLSSDSDDKFDRPAYGGSVAHKIGDTTLKAQFFMLGDYKNQDDSGAMLYGIGVDHKLDKKFTVYAVVAAANNEANSKVPLAGSGHGEKFAPSAGGIDPKGASVGMIFKF